MNRARRRLLSGVGAAGLAAALAGCTGGTSGTPVSVPDTHFQRSGNGNLLVRATVSNPSDTRRGVSLTVTADMSQQTLTRSQDVTLDAHTTTLVDTVFDVSWEQASKNLSVHATVTPA